MTGSELEILYRDPHYVAVNKPSGLLVHRSDLDRHETEFALQLVRDRIGCHVYPVHRLDRPTSGVLLFALSPEAVRRAAHVFESDGTVKTYLAVVRGVTDEAFVIDYPLRDLPDRYDEHGETGELPLREAVTSCRRLASVEFPFAVGPHPTARYSLLEISLLTGRRHQIRRHLKHVFHPVIGDSTYGDGRHNRLFRGMFVCSRLLLHAAELIFPHPNDGRTMTISAKLDDVFLSIIHSLEWIDAIPQRWLP